VSAEHRGDAPVEVPAHRDLLAGQLGVEVDDAGVHRSRQGVEQLVDRVEGIPLDLQVHLPAQVDHGDSHAGSLDDGVAAPGILGREVRRSHDPLLGAEKGIGLAMPIGVVAERDHVDAGRKDLLRRLLGDSHAPRGVLAVRDDQVRHPLGPKLGHRRRQGLPAGPADDVPYEQEAHRGGSVVDRRRGRAELSR